MTSFIIFMLGLSVIELLALVIFILDEKFDVVDKFIDWIGKKAKELDI